MSTRKIACASLVRACILSACESAWECVHVCVRGSAHIRVCNDYFSLMKEKSRAAQRGLATFIQGLSGHYK